MSIFKYLLWIVIEINDCYIYLFIWIVWFCDCWKRMISWISIRFFCILYVLYASIFIYINNNIFKFIRKISEDLTNLLKYFAVYEYSFGVFTLKMHLQWICYCFLILVGLIYFYLYGWLWMIVVRPRHIEPRVTPFHVDNHILKDEGSPPTMGPI